MSHTLLAVQRIDTTLDQLAHRRAHLPEAQTHADARRAAAAHATAISSAQQRLDAAAEAIEAAEAQGAVIAAKKTRLEAQLKTVIAPREAEALMHEIAILDQQRSTLDDGELEQMEAQAAAEADLVNLTAQQPDIDAAVDAAAVALADAQAEVDRQVAELRGERSTLTVSLSPADIELYEQARSRFGGVGIVTIEGTHCSGCHMDISRAELDTIKALPPDQLAECPQCNRYLVR